MSEAPFILPHPPRVTQEAARDLGRAYKAFADHLSELGVVGEARHADRNSQWWLTYAIALPQTQPKAD